MKSVDEIIQDPIEIVSPHVLIAEIWVCGGCNEVLVVCRIIYDARRNPRGEIKVVVFDKSDFRDGNITSSMPLLARTGFLNRRLCDDRGDSFAKTMTSERKYLCHTALRYLRGTQMPTSELDSTMDYCKKLCVSFFDERFAPLSVNTTALRIISQFQMICKAKLLKLKLKESKHTRKVI